jgi:hypothetical protein
VRRVGWSTTGASPNSRPIVGSVMPSGDVNLGWPRRDGSGAVRRFTAPVWSAQL